MKSSVLRSSLFIKQIIRDDDIKEIKSAYRALAKEYHPDKSR